MQKICNHVDVDGLIYRHDRTINFILLEPYYKEVGLQPPQEIAAALALYGGFQANFLLIFLRVCCK